jgi:hypothetical protein
MSSEFKLRGEITTDLEFIQFLEQLKSGSLASGVGTNRILERLSLNIDNVLDAVYQARMPQLWGGGTVAVDNPLTTLSWTADITVGMWSVSQGANGIRGTIAANPGGLAVAVNDALYVVIDRTLASPSALTLQKDTLTNYQTLVSAAGNTDRLDVVLIAMVLAGGIYWCDGKILKVGESFTEFSTDSQYGQQTELTQVREQQLDNLKLMMIGGALHRARGSSSCLRGPRPSLLARWPTSLSTGTLPPGPSPMRLWVSSLPVAWWRRMTPSCWPITTPRTLESTCGTAPPSATARLSFSEESAPGFSGSTSRTGPTSRSLTSLKAVPIRQGRTR